MDALSAEVASTRLSQVAHNMAMHAVSTLNSMDNVTVLIVLLCGGPERCPLDLSAPPALSASGRSTPIVPAVDFSERVPPAKVTATNGTNGSSGYGGYVSQTGRGVTAGTGGGHSSFWEEPPPKSKNLLPIC